MCIYIYTYIYVYIYVYIYIHVIQQFGDDNPPPTPIEVRSLFVPERRAEARPPRWQQPPERQPVSLPAHSAQWIGEMHYVKKNVYKQMYLYIYIHVCTYIYLYIYIYVCTYIYKCI